MKKLAKLELFALTEKETALKIVGGTPEAPVGMNCNTEDGQDAINDWCSFWEGMGCDPSLSYDDDGTVTDFDHGCDDNDDDDNDDT